jgi:hypothetical protein
MSDRRNIAPDKKVRQEKKHGGRQVAPGAAQAVQPGRKPRIGPTTGTVAPEAQAPGFNRESDSTEQKVPRWLFEALRTAFSILARHLNLASFRISWNS